MINSCYHFPNFGLRIFCGRTVVSFVHRCL